MSFRGNIRAPPCNSISTSLLLARRNPWSCTTIDQSRLSKPSLPHHDPNQIIWTRSKKTTTKTKLKNLPQGSLPSLTSTEPNEPPEKPYPPVLQQHLNNVRKFSDCIVLTRVGDFYELYFGQVEQYAPLANLKIAKRQTSLGPVSMAGFQHGALNRYLRAFVMDLGKAVAISEQVPLASAETTGTGPKFDRRVTRIVTAGTLVDEEFMDPSESNWLLGVHLISIAIASAPRSSKVGLSWVDLSSGEFYTQVGDLASLPSLVARIRPREIVVPSSLESGGHSELQKLLGEGAYSLHYHQTIGEAPAAESWTPMLDRPISASEAKKLSSQELSAAHLVLSYLRDKLLDQNVRLQPPVQRSSSEHMEIDKQSLRSLEVRSTLRDGLFEGSLLHAVRRTVTKSGARLLSQRLVSPSMSLPVVNGRLDLVQEMLESESLREDVLALLKRTSDTRRLLQRFSISKGDADDLLSLAGTIETMTKVAEVLHEHILNRQNEDDSAELTCLWDLLGRFELDDVTKVAKAITEAIDEEGLNRQHSVEDDQRAAVEEMTAEVETADTVGDEGPKLAKRTTAAAVTSTADEEIWIMRKHASKTLQVAHRDLINLLGRKQQLLLKLREQLNVTGESLTLKWSAQAGHFVHVKGKNGKRHEGLEGARPISSTKSTQSFHLGEWTTLGVIIDDAILRIRREEEVVFEKLRARVIECLMVLRRNASVLDELDVACSSATIAKERELVRPVLNESTSHRIIGGRHPTVDVGLKEIGRQFTANDCLVGSSASPTGGQEANIYLITGPNMGGKSTYLRQNALITILAQTGMYVPAEYAEIGLVDKIFSRVGSADSLYQDQSTFMVEMLETAEILKSATPRSFVIMDEVGRGTTPEDGIAVGYASLHHLHYINKCRTLFATHFHSLADMTAKFSGVDCWCTDVEEQDGRGSADGEEAGNDSGEDSSSWSYAHKLRKGVNWESHALKVATLAGMPEEAVRVAGSVLQDSRRQRVGDAGQLLPHERQRPLEIRYADQRLPASAAGGTA